VFPIFIADDQEDAQKRYIERKRANVGLAKAGWLAASDAIGKTRVGGKATAWLRKLAGKATGTGVLKELSNGVNITLYNTVPHAQAAMNGRLMDKVPRNIEYRMLSYMQKVLKGLAKKMS